MPKLATILRANVFLRKFWPTYILMSLLPIIVVLPFYSSLVFDGGWRYGEKVETLCVAATLVSSQDIRTLDQFLSFGEYPPRRVWWESLPAELVLFEHLECVRFCSGFPGGTKQWHALALTYLFLAKSAEGRNAQYLRQELTPRGGVLFGDKTNINITLVGS